MTTDPLRRAALVPLAAASLLACTVAGCAAGDGLPWGVWYPELSVVHEAESRLTDDGSVRTAQQYHVRVDELSIELAELSLRQAGAGSAGSFDPANPPEGYGLCHAGHCHREDGALIDYADIEAELLEGDAGANAATSAVDASVSLSPEPTVVPGGTCSDGCALERGALRSVAARVVSISFRLTATDPEVGRLAEPVEFVGSLALDATVTAAIDARVGQQAAPYVVTPTTVSLAPTWLDAIDFTSLPTSVDSDDADAIASAVADALTLSVSVQRRLSPPGELR